MDKQRVKNLMDPNYFEAENFKIGFKIILGSHNVNHANSLLTIKLKYPEFGIETR